MLRGGRGLDGLPFEAGLGRDVPIAARLERRIAEREAPRDVVEIAIELGGLDLAEPPDAFDPVDRDEDALVSVDGCGLDVVDAGTEAHDRERLEDRTRA